MSEQPSNLGIAQLKQQVAQLAQNGKMLEALKKCEELSLKVPHDPEIHFLMGAIFGGMSEFEKAKQCFLHILPAAPEHPVLNYNLANALIHLEKIPEAIPYLETAIQSQPDYIDAYRELANALSLDKQYAEAEKHYNTALQLDPESAPTHYNYANTLRDQKKFNEAINQYEIAILLQPDTFDFHNQLSTALLSNYKYAKAIKALENAISFFPVSDELHFKLAIAHQDQGDIERAQHYYKKTLSLNSGHTEALVGIAGACGLEGDYKSACATLEEILEKQPTLPSALITYGQYAHQSGNTKNAINLIIRSIENSKYSDPTLSKLYFTLGHLYEKSEKIDGAFKYYQKGNTLRGAEFDIETHMRALKMITEMFSVNNIPQFPQANNASPSPIFIVGMPRSGTSLVEQILASHPNVFGAGELPYIDNIIQEMVEQSKAGFAYPKDINTLEKGDLQSLSERYLSLIPDKATKKAFFTDKLPSNFWHLGFIDMLFPNAKIIHCARNPIDTCLSCYFKHFSGEHVYAYDLESLGQYYKIYEQLMAHWKETLRLPVYDLNYENIIENQESETRKLLKFCHLEWNDHCLNYYDTKRSVSTASHDQVRKPIYTSSVNRWEKYATHLTPLLSILNTKK